MDHLTDYLTDTVAFVRYLEDRLPPRVDRVFRDAEAGRNHLLIPEIALAEFLYIALRGRLRGPRPELLVREVLHDLSASEAFTVSSMPSTGWEVFLDLRVRELHDRMIASEAIARGVPLISNDPVFDGVPRLRAIW